LRHQLAVYKKTVTRPKVRRSDRLFWVALSRVWAGWRQVLVIVSPNTVLRWQRRRFCEHWTKLSARPIAGRPPVDAEIKALVTRMAAANPLWGAPRIHGELLRLGIDVSERTVSRLMPKRRPCRLRPGGRSSPTMSAISSPSISSRCQPRACVSCPSPKLRPSPSD
jgi:putative transposase